MITFNNSVINAGETPAIIAGLWADAPVNAQTPIGTIYITTDTLLIYRNDGTAWQPLAAGGSAPDINTVLGVGNTALDKTQVFTDLSSNYELALSKVLIVLRDYLTNEYASIDKNNIAVADVSGDFAAGLFSLAGVQSQVYARTDKYRFLIDPAVQEIRFDDFAGGGFMRLKFPNIAANTYDITFPTETGTVKLIDIYGGNIDLSAGNYSLTTQAYNQYFDVIATGAGNINCDNMQAWPDGSEVKICVNATGFNFVYTLGTFAGNATINKQGLYTLKIVANTIYCSDPA